MKTGDTRGNKPEAERDPVNEALMDSRTSKVTIGFRFVFNLRLYEKSIKEKY